MEDQTDLIALALVSLVLGLALILEAMAAGKAPPGLILIALVPLTLPIAASRLGAFCAGGCLVLAIVLLLLRSPSPGLGRTHRLTLFTGIVLAALCLARAWIMEASAPASDSPSTLALWAAVLQGPPFAEASTSTANDQRFRKIGG